VKFLSSKLVPNVIAHDKFWVDRIIGSRTPDSESCHLNIIDPYYTSGYRLSVIRLVVMILFTYFRMLFALAHMHMSYCGLIKKTLTYLLTLLVSGTRYRIVSYRFYGRRIDLYAHIFM